MLRATVKSFVPRAQLEQEKKIPQPVPVSPVNKFTEFPQLVETSFNGHGSVEFTSPKLNKDIWNHDAYYLTEIFRRGSINSPPDFVMNAEDFPALPGLMEDDDDGYRPRSNSSETRRVSISTVMRRRTKSRSYSIQSTDSTDSGKSGRPRSYSDDYRLFGLARKIRAASLNSKCYPMTMGIDLSSFGIDTLSSECLVDSFPGPWSNVPLSPHEIDIDVPKEYFVNRNISDHLGQVKSKDLCDDVMFYLFYNFVNTTHQIDAAIELYQRDWRFHREQKMWLTRAPGTKVSLKNEDCERGVYYFFDPTQWRKIARETFLFYDHLEKHPAEVMKQHDFFGLAK